jgi:hypothetical protein
MTKLTHLLSQIRLESQYPNSDSWEKQDLYETYAIISEFLDAENAFDYRKVGKATWEYEDSLKNAFYVKLTFVPGLSSENESYLELKSYWTNDQGKPMYSDFNGKSSSVDLQRSSDTTAKIFRNEVIPFFDSQSISKELRIVPVDPVRYRLSKMMVKKYAPFNYDVSFEPKYVSIRKKD